MVRPEVDQNLIDNYSFLADIYDDLMIIDRSNYDIWRSYVKKYIHGKKILELASGSGIFASLLEEDGYNVLASDISKAMRKRASFNFNGAYIDLDMRHIDLEDSFDGVVCILDSINYLADGKELDATFEGVYDHLNDNGIFIFDAHSFARIDEFKNPYIEEGEIDGVKYQWTIRSDEMDMSIVQNFVFYLDDRIIRESHIQIVHRSDVLIKAMEKAGFKVTYIPDFIENEKELFIGEKK